MKPVYRIEKGSRAGIVCCSDGRKIRTGEELDRLTGKLESLGLRPQLSPCIFARDGAFSGTGRERAQALMDFYRDDSIRVIFDISGGNAANEVLPFLDYSVIAGADKLFWGYSDLTALMNAVFARTGRPSVLWQAKNLLWDDPGEGGQGERFARTVLGTGSDLFAPECRLLRGFGMEGITAGGNIRCLLKLAGTPFWPDLQGKILVLEARSGGPALVETMFCQLAQTGAFGRIAGLLLGTFTQLEREGQGAFAEKLALELTPPGLAVAKTREVGHGKDSRAILLGSRAVLRA